MLKRIISALLLLALVPPAAYASQATFALPIVGPLSMAEFVDDHLNPALASVSSCHSGTSAPVNGPGAAPVQGQCWIDTTTGTLFIEKIYDGTDWVERGRINTTANNWRPTIVGTSITALSGTGATLALTTSPVFVTPNIGTPSAGTLTNATGLPIIDGTTGTLTTTRGGTGSNNTATSARFLKGDGTNFITSSGSASGVGSCTAGSFVSGLNSDAAPTCTASGAGTGDLLAANNLSDVANLATAFNTIKQAASTTATGVVELATNAETTTGTDTTRATTPAGVAAAIGAIPAASTTVSGLIELATTTETTTGTDAVRAVTPSGVAAAISAIPLADGVTAGLVELATNAETIAGTINDLATTPSGVNASIENAVSSGVYAPSFSSVANITGTPTVAQPQFLRVFDVVTVSGRVIVDPTAASTTTQLRVEIPVPSAFTVSSDAAGTIVGSDDQGNVGTVSAETAVGNRVLMEWIPPTANNRIMFYHYTYRIR